MFVPSPYVIECINKKDAEDETKVVEIVMVKLSWLKIILIMPLLTIITVGVVILFIHWYVPVKMFLLFTRVKKLSDATHLKVLSTRKQKEIVTLKRVSFIHYLVYSFTNTL